MYRTLKITRNRPNPRKSIETRNTDVFENKHIDTVSVSKLISSNLLRQFELNHDPFLLKYDFIGQNLKIQVIGGVVDVSKSPILRF